MVLVELLELTLQSRHLEQQLKLEISDSGLQFHLIKQNELLMKLSKMDFQPNHYLEFPLILISPELAQKYLQLLPVKVQPALEFQSVQLLNQLMA